MIRTAVIDKIKDSIIASIRNTGHYAFSLSQNKCPVKTGYLKSTGNCGNIEDGFEIVYFAEYASFVHSGTKAGTRHVRSYHRRDGAFIKEHSYYSKGQKSQPFIKDGINDAYTENFGDNLFGQLIQQGFRVERM